MRSCDKYCGGYYLYVFSQSGQAPSGKNQRLAAPASLFCVFLHFLCYNIKHGEKVFLQIFASVFLGVGTRFPAFGSPAEGGGAKR